MSRVAVCLFFIAIFHNGILKSVQANETTTDGLSENNEAVTTKPTEAVTESVGVPSETKTTKKEANDAPQKQAEKSEEEKITKVNVHKKEDETESTTKDDNRKAFLNADVSDKAKAILDIPKKILEPVGGIGTKIKEVVNKGVDSAKDLASGTFNFIKSAVNGVF